MRYYAGLDVSLEETAICVIDEEGTIIKETSVSSEPDALVSFFLTLSLKVERIGLEACSLTAWLHDGLEQAGLPAICMETRHAKAAMGAMPVKTDRNDARALAQIIRTGWFRSVHVKSEESRCWRALLTARKMVLNKLRDLENGIRASLRECGLKVGRPSRKQFAERVRELAEGNSVLMSLIEPVMSIIAVMIRELDHLTKQVLAIVRAEPICRRLMTTPGVGPLTALTYRATIDRPERFRRSRDVGAHLGLTPKRHQSGETDLQGSISRCGDELARTALYEAAHSLLMRSTKWSALRAWGMAIAKRRGMARARVAVARKLAVILHSMWRNDEDFRWSANASTVK